MTIWPWAKSYKPARIINTGALWGTTPPGTNLLCLTPFSGSSEALNAEQPKLTALVHVGRDTVPEPVVSASSGSGRIKPGRPVFRVRVELQCLPEPASWGPLGRCWGGLLSVYECPG